MKTLFTNELYKYVIEHSVHENEVLNELREHNHTLPTGHMQITQDQGQFMAFLAKLINAKTYLEVGVFTGYSTLLMALAMGNDAKIYALDFRSDHLEVAKKYWKKAGVLPQIDVYFDDALISLNNMLNRNLHNSIDIAFIDAKKSDYRNYYECCYKLVKPGGVLIIDNIFMRGEVLKSETKSSVNSIKEFNDFLHQWVMHLRTRGAKQYLIALKLEKMVLPRTQ